MSISLIYSFAQFAHFAHFVIKVFAHFLKWVEMFAHLFILLICSFAHFAHLEKIVLGVPWAWYTQVYYKYSRALSSSPFMTTNLNPTRNWPKPLLSWPDKYPNHAWPEPESTHYKLAINPTRHHMITKDDLSRNWPRRTRLNLKEEMNRDKPDRIMTVPDLHPTCLI